MSSKRSPGSIERRTFLKGALTSATVATFAGEALAQEAVPSAQSQAPATPSKLAGPSAQQIAQETQPPAEVRPLTTKKTGSDFMVDVVKTLNIDYLPCLPGSTFRGLHESFINNPPHPNQKPEFISCLHEEASIAMAHGYAKAAGKPLAVMVHGTVGLQHASMAIYNAYVDRVPMMILSGNANDAIDRRPGVEWRHSVQDGAALVRDFVKWDDNPGSLQAWADSTIRAYQLTNAVPMAPVLLVADTKLQEEPLEPDAEAKLRIPKYRPAGAPQADGNGVRELAKMLVGAENPVIIAERYARTDQAMPLLAQLAETLNAPVVDKRGRVNFPNRHPFNLTPRGGSLLRQADVILGLELSDIFGVLNSMSDQLFRETHSHVKPTAKIAHISSGNLLIHANYQDFERFTSVDLELTGDAEATMPALIEAVKSAMPDSRRSALEARGKKLTGQSKGFAKAAWKNAGAGWDASPISTARLDAEIWAQIKDDPDWALATDHAGWASRLWIQNKPWHHNGGSGAAGVGQGSPAAVGAALAHKQAGRYTIAIVGDGDFNMVGPGSLWTAAHHQLPLLMIVHNNRAYHQEVMHIQRMANRHNRGIDRGGIGSVISKPDIDYAKVVEGMGVRGIGPISDPKDLGPAIKTALVTVKKGEPALIDVVSQPR
jgi:thiamine pyrophosphate-dependent acetolactate synthase large subunit-like protein